MSSQPRIEMTNNATSDFVVFKTLHMIEYGLLFFLFYRAFHSVRQLGELFPALTGGLISVVFAASDELHQLSIPTRQGKVRDVLIDIVGMLVVYGMMKSVRFVRRLL